MQVFEFTPEGVSGCSVTAWLHGNERFPELQPYAKPRPAMVICPGGGYLELSQREAEPIAKQYFAAGYHTFVLYYSIGKEAQALKPLCQLAATVAHLRKQAKQWNLAEDKIAVSGFSAGGHLACSLGTLFNEARFLEAFGRDADVRPDAMVLGYPVITADRYAHSDSIHNVSGAEVGTELYNWFGLDTHVDSCTPPAFIWHTAEDDVVPVENSLQLAKALSAQKIPYELHILPYGPHGMSACNEEVNTPCEHNKRWIQWSIQWLNKILKFEN